jgi:hypothetical protein
MLEGYGFGNHGPRAARTSQSGDRRQQVQKQDGEIAHRTIVSRSRHRKNAHEFCNSPRTGEKVRFLRPHVVTPIRWMLSASSREATCGSAACETSCEAGNCSRLA